MNRVIYPGLPSHPQADVASRILDGGGAMLSVDLAGGREAGRTFFDALTIPERTASLGSVHTMVVHPPSSSHRSLDAGALAAAGITEGLLRVSVGLEDEADLHRRLRGRARRGAGDDPGRDRPRRGLPSPPSRRAVRPPAPSPARLPASATPSWGLLTSVNFAVVQIIVLSLFAVVGMTLRQLPGFAFRSPTDYANEMDEAPRPVRPGARHGRRGRAGAAPAVARVQLDLVQHRARRADHLDRRLHARPHPAAVAPERGHPRRPAGPVLRPDAAGPGADGRASPRPTSPRCCAATGSSCAREVANGATYVYGDRNRWVKLATLLSHPGLVLFLVAAAVTSRLGDEQGLVVAEGESLTVQPIGTPGLLLVRNLGFEAPGFLETGQATRLHDPTSPCTRTASRSPRRRSASTTRSPSAATRSTRTGSGRRRTS